jgi:flagellar hook protein FlgE
MSFNIALSGLNAAQKDLDVTSNNIANVNTIGFKESRAEFVDVYASSLLSSGKTQVGGGVLTADVAQQFGQGSVIDTNNSLDLAIEGNGFFATTPELGSKEFSYTRAGAFKINANDFIVNSAGEHLMGFPVGADGSSSSVSLSTAEPISIPTASGAPQKTTEVDVKVNLPGNDSVITGSPLNFDPADILTYNASTSQTIYDSLGDSHVLKYFFIKEPATAAGTNPWILLASVDGTLIDLEDTAGVATGILGGAGATNGARLTFDASGEFIDQTPLGGFSTAALGAGILNNGSDPGQQIIIDFNLDAIGSTALESTQYSGKFEPRILEQNGLPVGRLTGIEIGVDGLVMATYSNNTTEPLARVLLVDFPNDQGLTQTGNTSWKQSLLSGTGLAGEPAQGTFGKIKSSALEQSNVNLTLELIDLISAQRNFSANSRSLEVSNQMNQTILQIR